MRIQVRKATTKDAEKIHQAHMKSIQEICSKDHSHEEIQGWGNRPYREDQRLYAIQNDHVWVVDYEGSIEGYGHLKITMEDSRTIGSILGLYLTSKVVGKSFGKKIIQLMMLELKAAQAESVFLESTITARDFYRKIGFVDDGPEQAIKIGGSSVRCYPMKMELKEFK